MFVDRVKTAMAKAPLSDAAHLEVSLLSVRPWDSTVKAFNVMKSTNMFHSVLIQFLEEDLEYEREHLKSLGVKVDERAAL